MNYILLPILLVFIGCGTDETSPLAQAEEIAQKGPKGDRGPIGPQGPKGDKGDPGEDGKDGVLASIYDWQDPFTDKWYLIGGPSTAAEAICPEGYSVPDSNDALPAYNHGIHAFLVEHSHSPLLWIKNINDDDVEAYKDMSDFTTTAASNGGTIFCQED